MNITLVDDDKNQLELLHRVIKIRHVLKYIVNAVRHFIDTNDKSGLADFCDKVEETQLYIGNIPYTGCSAVYGVLYHYIRRSEDSDIDFCYKGILSESML